MNEIEGDTTPNLSPTSARFGAGRIIVIGFAVVMVVGFGVVAMSSGRSAVESGGALRMSTVTVSLEQLPTEMAEMYRFAADHAELFSQIPCYCGCDRSLGHRNLEDCFVTPDGRWDAHASGCGICTLEASSAQGLIAAGADNAVVRQTIIDRFGPPPAQQQGARP